METPPLNPLLKPPPRQIPHVDDQITLAITRFLEAYNNDPSQYGSKQPIDLIHKGWLRRYEDTLRLAAGLGSVHFYQFIIDTGIEVSNRQFLGDLCAQQPFSYSFTKYLLNLCPNRIDLVPPYIIFFFLFALAAEKPLDVLKLFWDHCPALKDPDFLNSEIKKPYLSRFTNLIDVAERCIANGGDSGDDLSLALEQLDNVYIINLLTSKALDDNGPILLLQSFIENSDINLAPLYRTINPTLHSQNGLKALDDLSGSLFSMEQFFRIPKEPPPTESITWYLNWWKNDVLGDAMSLNQFKTFILNILKKAGSQRRVSALPFLEYLGDDFFASLSPSQTFSHLDTIVKRIGSWNHIDPKPAFPFLSTILSFPSVAIGIKAHWIYFTRTILRQLLEWDCVELCLKLSGLTMDDIWSDHGYDDTNDGNSRAKSSPDDIFTLKTIISSNPTGLFLPVYLVDWLSCQPGTQEQLINMVKSKHPPSSDDWTHLSDKSLRQLFIFMNFSYDQQIQRQQQIQPTPPPQLIPQSISWLQSLIAHTSIDYMKVKFTLNLWNNRNLRSGSGRRSPLPTCCMTLVGEEASISLPHFPIIMNERADEADNGPAFLLEDIIRGVIASLLIDHQSEREGDEDDSDGDNDDSDDDSDDSDEE